MKLYLEAAKFLDNKTGDGSLKSRVFSDKTLSTLPNQIYALVYSTLKYVEHIDYIIEKLQLQKSVKTSVGALRAIVHDLIFSPRNRLQLGKHPLKDSILKHGTRIHAETVKLQMKFKVKNPKDLPAKESIDEDESPYRWFRINPLKISPDKFWLQDFFNELEQKSSLKKLTSKGQFYQDEFIDNLYAVHIKEPLSKTKLYINGEIIIQDRGSCFPVQILNADTKLVHKKVIDACAAPGNKTTLVAAFLPKEDDLVVYAFERDRKRVEILKSMCHKASGKANNHLFQINHLDFTKTNPQDFPDVTGLIIDPSCSGSGMFGRAYTDAQDENGAQETGHQRIEKLASFQVTIMKHALLFPSASRVVYSTCSIHNQENEQVVTDLLRDKRIRADGWTLANRSLVLPRWPRRGITEEFEGFSELGSPEALAGGCVRANPRVDGGIGFFAACFIRKLDSSEHVDQENSHKGANQDPPSDSEYDDWNGFE